MTDEKLNGIIKALKLCTGSETACKDCPCRASVSPSFFVRCEDTLHEASLEAIESLRAENAALRSGMQYLIDDGGADCCARCIYCPQPTEEDDDCDCQHKGECVDGMIKWFEEQREELQGGEK